MFRISNRVRFALSPFRILLHVPNDFRSECSTGGTHVPPLLRWDLTMLRWLRYLGLATIQQEIECCARPGRNEAPARRASTGHDHSWTSAGHFLLLVRLGLLPCRNALGTASVRPIDGHSCLRALPRIDHLRGRGVWRECCFRPGGSNHPAVFDGRSAAPGSRGYVVQYGRALGLDAPGVPGCTYDAYSVRASTLGACHSFQVQVRRSHIRQG